MPPTLESMCSALIGCRRVAVLGVVASLLVACDPTWHYRPIQWKAAGAMEWTSLFEGMTFTTFGIGGGLGAADIVLEFRVENPTTKRLTFESAEILADGRTYRGRLSAGDPKWRTVEPGSSGSTNVFFEFDRPATEALANDTRLSLALRIDDQLKKLSIRYVPEE